MIKVLKKLLPKTCYFYVKQIYIYLKIIYEKIKYKDYDLTKDLNYNENLFKSLKFDINKIKLKLKSLNFHYYDPKLSWHYHLFLGLKDYFGNKKINILEIGTLVGDFSNFVAKIYDESQITTIDLDESEDQFKNTYDRDQKEKLKKFLNLRNNNLNKENIDFIKLDSSLIKEYFIEKKFDLIWVDGDHNDPQVTMDIINSLDLLNKDGIICVDDVILNENFKKTKYVSNESFKTLKKLENQEIIKNYFLIKRITMSNSVVKKYISISIFKGNSKFIT